MAQLPGIGLYKPCINLPFGGLCHVLDVLWPWGIRFFLVRQRDSLLPSTMPSMSIWTNFGSFLNFSGIEDDPTPMLRWYPSKKITTCSNRDQKNKIKNGDPKKKSWCLLFIVVWYVSSQLPPSPKNSRPYDQGLLTTILRKGFGCAFLGRVALGGYS